MNQQIWSITKKQEIKTSKQKLWEIISAPENLSLFHPFCEKNTVKKWPGANSKDIIYYYSGLVYERNFVTWEEKKGYDLLIGKKNGKKSFVRWKITNEKRNTFLTISIYPFLYNEKKNMKNFVLFNIFVRRLISQYLNSVLKGLDYYVRTNEKVEKNQFGGNRFFSN